MIEPVPPASKGAGGLSRLGTLAVPGTYTTGGGPLVGRTVANAQWLRALALHSSLDELVFFIGEAADVPALEALVGPWKVPDGRLVIHHVLQLPQLLAQGTLDVLHHPAHVERLFDLFALRDRYATRAVPVTGQTHSLSYPRLFQETARLAFLGASATDAIFCSSTAGQLALSKGYDAVDAALAARGASPLLRPALPVVPLGVDCAALGHGDRAATRAALGVDDACVFLCLARFTEADKLDLFPLLRAFADVVRTRPSGAQRPHLLLAGARQGTKTPEMVELWAKALGIAPHVSLRVDFPDHDKPHLLAAADVFVSPVDNVQETFGQSVVEAMAAGLPAVVSDFDGYRDTVTEDVGLRVPARLNADWSELSHVAPLLYERPLHLLLGQSVEVEHDALVRALSALLVDRPRREALGKAAAARAKTTYDWPVVVRQLEVEWRRLQGQPFSPSGAAHALRLDFPQTFGHFGASARGDATLVVRGDLPPGAGRGYVVYPELKALFDEGDVERLRATAAQPVALGELTRALVSPDRPEWMTRQLVAWALKHGVLRPVG